MTEKPLINIQFWEKFASSWHKLYTLTKSSVEDSYTRIQIPDMSERPELIDDCLTDEEQELVLAFCAEKKRAQS